MYKNKKRGYDMKLSFSTLGCPDFNWSEIYSMARDFRFDGIEVRGIGDDICEDKSRPFSDEHLPATIEKLRKLNLEIPCLSSGCALKFRDREKENIDELKKYISLAEKLGTPYIRVLGDLTPMPDGEVDDDYIISVINLLRGILIVKDYYMEKYLKRKQNQANYHII